MKKIIVFVLVMIIFSLPTAAADEIYSEQYEISGADELKYALDKETQAFFEENGLEISGYDWVNKLSRENVFSHLLSLIRGKVKNPLSSCAMIICIILITAAVTSFGDENGKYTAALYAAALAITAIIASDIWKSVCAATSAVKGSATFMLSFIPVFAGTVALSGGSISAVSMSALLLGAAETVSFAASFLVLPLMGGYLALSICSGVSPILEGSDITELVKKMAVWAISFISTLFVGILGIQTAVNSSADTLAMKSAKFIIGTSVPIAGPALSEAASTISASLSLLKSSIGIYGVVAVAVIFIPVIAELIIWRAVMLACSSVSSLFSLPKISALLKAVDSMLSLLLGITLLVGSMFIISLTVTVTGVKV